MLAFAGLIAAAIAIVAPVAIAGAHIAQVLAHV